MILTHYPPVIKQIKDIQQIAKAEDIEFTKLNTSITEVIRNMFVFTADETGVKRFTFKICDTVRRRLYYFTRQQRGTMAGIGES